MLTLFCEAVSESIHNWYILLHSYVQRSYSYQFIYAVLGEAVQLKTTTEKLAVLTKPRLSLFFFQTTTEQLIGPLVRA